MSSLAVRRFRLTAKQALAIVGGLLGVCWLVVLFTHDDQLQPVIFGVGTGALIAAIALGATLTYRGSGVVNFSVSAIAVYAAYVFYDLYANGSLFFPPPIPSVQLVHVRYTSGFPPTPIPPMSIWTAFAITVVICGVLGLLFHLLIFRPLRRAPAIAKVVASIGLFLFLVSVVQVRFPLSSSGYGFPSILPTSTWQVGSLVIPQNLSILLGIVVAVAAILWAIFRYTRYGLAVRAAAENERGALILGYNPDRLGAVTWIVSTMLVGAMGILYASINGTIDPITAGLLIVPALAASLVARFRSFPITVLTAVFIGACQAWVQTVSSESWFPSFLTSQGTALQGLVDVIPFAIIVVVLFLRGERLPSRGSEAALRMPKAYVPAHPVAYGAVLSILVMASAFLLSTPWREALQLSVIAVIMCASLTVLTGFVGQISLMQLTIAGVAGFVLSKFCDAHGIPFPLGALIAAAAAMVVGLIAAVPALRIRGVNLAIVTLAAAVVIEDLVYNLPIFRVGFTVQSQALVKPPSIFGFAFGPNSSFKKLFGHPSGSLPNPWFSVFCVLVAVAVLAGVLWIRRSRLGRRMLAVRSNERAAAAAGISVPRTKVLAFAISAFIAGIGGVLYGYNFGNADGAFLSSFNSLILIAVAYIGGISMLEGAPISGILVQSGIFATFLAVIVHISPLYAVYIASVGLILTSINNPEGLAGTLHQLRAHARARRHRAAPPAVEGATPPPAPRPLLGEPV
jgi:branched-chain amino acid transport system permease protein